ncbi:hypothetical protein GCM10022291_32860 [Postechiella marina]|uniref:Uncharacterized protein n=1 Tax=Postechiella marina TaxID=943941 RepID=A0ABP8CHV9_9FLAO
MKPCSDGNNFEEQHQDEISAEHNHKNDSDDMCSMNCACSCCGIAITYQQIQTFELGLNNQITTEMISIYNSIYRFDFHSNIWQPPQLIS